MITLTQGQLNRTFLARQHLLQRSDLSVHDMVSQLVAVQSQEANSPYESLWARIKGFEPKHLDQAYLDKTVVRGTWFRSTVHTVTREDYLNFRGVHSRAFYRAVEGYLEDHHIEEWHPAIRDALAEAGPVHGPAWVKVANATIPGYTPETWKAHLFRRSIPMLRHPKDERGRTHGPRDAWVEAESYLGEAPLPHDQVDLKPLLHKYLAAYGPATIRDATWFLGLTHLREWFDQMELVRYQTEGGTTLYDNPEGAIVDSETPAPPRLMASFDHTILGHSDRNRIIDQAHSPILSGPNAFFKPYILIDGRVTGWWDYSWRDGTDIIFRYFDRPTDEQEQALISEAKSWSQTWFLESENLRFDIDMHTD